MKLFLILLAGLVSLNVMAFDVCEFDDTSTFDDAVVATDITEVKTSSDHNAFTATEKKMIWETMLADKYNANMTMKEALLGFGDFHEYSHGKPGSNAGSIVYYQVGKYKFALVHSWPGDNEYGAFVEVANDGSIEILATVNDGFMECK
jgi:hypothetical protein